jgi:cytochrome P450
MANIPGPPLPAVVQTAIYLARPVEFVEFCRRRYGETFAVNTLLFGPEVVVSSPEDVRRVFTGDPAVFHAGEANAPLEPLIGPRSVLVLDGAEHVRQRRLMMPPFHGERMMAYGKTMREVAEGALAGLPAGRRVSLLKPMQQMTLEIILRTILGADDEGERAELGAALTAMLDRITSGLATIFTLPPLRHEAFGLSPWAAFRRAAAHADRLIYARIARRRGELARPGGPARQDILTMLLEARDEQGQPMTDGELRDELVTLLVAGHETTATMLCWALDLILGDARVLGRLQAELAGAGGEAALDRPAELGRLPYLDAVIKEVLRLRPVIPAVGRRLKAPVEMGGRTLPEGTLLVPWAYLAHQNAGMYPAPGAFRPERFLEKKPDTYAWFPFGGGARRCLGMAFALFEMKVVLATTLVRLRLRRARAGETRIRMRTFMFAPDRGAEVVIEGRAARIVARAAGAAGASGPAPRAEDAA